MWHQIFFNMVAQLFGIDLALPHTMIELQRYFFDDNTVAQSPQVYCEAQRHTTNQVCEDYGGQLVEVELEDRRQMGK